MKISRYCDQIIIVTLVVLIIVVPLFFDIKLYSVFDLSKVVAMILPALLIMAVWLIKIIFNEEFKFPYTHLNLPILAFLTLTIIATIFSINPYMSLMGTYKRYEGLIETCTYIFLFFAFVSFINNVRKLNIVINAIVATAVITSIYGFIQYFGKDPFKWSSSSPERVFSTFGNPVFYSAFLITILPLSLALYLGYQTSEKKTNGFSFFHRGLVQDIIYGICTLLIYTIFWHTKTRADFVGLMVLLPLFIIFLGKERIYANRWKLSIMFVLFIAIGTFYSIRPQSSVFNYFAREITFVENKETENNVIESSYLNDRSFLANKLSGSSFNRYYQFKTALKIYNEYPILGLGPDTLGILYQKYLAKVFTKRKDDEWWPRHDRIHNDVLDNVVARGAIGLSAYIWLILAYFWLVWKFLKAESSKLKAEGSKLTNKLPTANCQLPIDQRLLVVSFGSALFGYIVQNEFSFGNTPIVALFWTVLALTIIVIKKTGGRFFERSFWDGDNSQSSLPNLIRDNHQPQIHTPQSLVRKALLSLLVLSLTAFLIIHVLCWYKADIYAENGRKYARKDDLENGIKYYENAIFYNPYEVNYRDMLNNALFKAAQVTNERLWLENIINVANKNLQIVPQHYLGFFALGNAYYLFAQNFGEQTVDLAIENYKKAIEADPFQPQMYHHLAMSYSRKGMFDEATKALEKAIIFEPNNVKYIDKLSRIYLQQNRLGEIKKLLDETTISNPTASFCNVKGFFLSKIGKKEDAYIEFTKALKIDSNNMDALNNVINLGLLLKKTDDTIKYLKYAIELKPSNVDYRMNLGNLYAKKGLLDESIAEFNQIIQIDPNKQVDCLDKLGKIYLAQNDFDNAMLCFKKAIEISPSNAELYNNLGTIYAQKNLYDEATLEIKKALSIAPDNITFLGNIAKIYYIQERFKETEDILNHIIKLDANNKEATSLLEQINQGKKINNEDSGSE